MVIAIVAIAAVPILGQFRQLSLGALVNEEIQVAAQLAQEGAEQVLATRRNLGYSSVVPGTQTETLTGEFNQFSRTVAINDATTSSACPASASCRNIVVTVSRASRNRAEVNYLLIDY